MFDASWAASNSEAREIGSAPIAAKALRPGRARLPETLANPARSWSAGSISRTGATNAAFKGPNQGRRGAERPRAERRRHTKPSGHQIAWRSSGGRSGSALRRSRPWRMGLHSLGVAGAMRQDRRRLGAALQVGGFVVLHGMSCAVEGRATSDGGLGRRQASRALLRRASRSDRRRRVMPTISGTPALADSRTQPPMTRRGIRSSGMGWPPLLPAGTRSSTRADSAADDRIEAQRRRNADADHDEGHHDGTFASDGIGGGAAWCGALIERRGATTAGPTMAAVRCPAARANIDGCGIMCCSGPMQGGSAGSAVSLSCRRLGGDCRQ